MNTHRKHSIITSILASVAVAGLMFGASSCGSKDSDSSAATDEQALIESLLTAAQDGDPSAITDILAAADPDLLDRVLPRVEADLGIDFDTPSTSAADGNATASDEEADNDLPPHMTTPTTTPASTPANPSATPSSSAPSPSIPKITMPGVPTLPTPVLPTTTAPASTSSIPRITIPSSPTLPSVNLPTPAVIEDVSLLNEGRELRLEVLVSGGLWHSSTRTRSPESVFVRYRTSTGALQSKYLILTNQLGTNTSVWSELVLADANPCSFEIAVSPSTTLQRFRLSDTC